MTKIEKIKLLKELWHVKRILMDKCPADFRDAYDYAKLDLAIDAEINKLVKDIIYTKKGGQENDKRQTNGNSQSKSKKT